MLLRLCVLDRLSKARADSRDRSTPRSSGKPSGPGMDGIMPMNGIEKQRCVVFVTRTFLLRFVSRQRGCCVADEN